MNFLSTIRTKQEHDELLEKIDELLLNLYDAKHHLVLPDVLREESRRKKPGLKSKEDLAAFLQSARGQLQKLPVLALSTAVSLPPTFLKEILAKLEAFKVRAVVEIKTDKNLIGGATLSFNGLYKDYSLRKKLEKLLVI